MSNKISKINDIRPYYHMRTFKTSEVNIIVKRQSKFNN